MKRTFTLFALVPLAILGLCTVGCDDDENISTPTQPPETESYSIGGDVTGLDGTVVLTNNGGDALTMTADGAFVFATDIEDGEDYDVEVLTDPLGQGCTVANGQGTVDGADVTDVAVTCTDDNTDPGPYTIGGTVSGLQSGELVLQNGSGIDFRTLRKNGEYTFPRPYPDLTPYQVTVSNQPPGPEICVVLNNRGVIDGADVTNIDVVCAEP